MPTVTVLDDYQDVARSSADWSPSSSGHAVDVISEHIADPDRLVQRLRAARSSS